MCRESWRDKESHSLRLLTITVLSIVPVALMVLTATGYFYTTLRLAGRWIETVYLVMIWNLLYQTVLRGLSVAARRIAWRRALARRQHLVKEGAEGAEPQEEPTIALEQVNQQTLRITMLVMIALFAVMFWAIWSDLITVFAYLDSITLWHYNGTEAGASVVRSVTMGSLLFAIVASMVAWALIRNLPGLLEVLVLSRLNMRQGTSYAITTILNYAIIAIGAMTVFGSLGVSWDKLQWLAAALSVGLGFGLQEIFGNFVSGLIILFERPVRIGDTVTIGTFSGTVSKIRIRATTITDFDRKEVIIPNKAFVTERLINWSLSDTVTRVVIRLGVAYGSDLDKVKEVLLKAAHDHPKVMQEPAPAVFFTTFGASTLDHELRLYVRELRDRSYTVDELNRAIDRLCRENDINIAFNQLEVHLRNEKGDEVTEVKRDGKGGRSGAHHRVLIEEGRRKAAPAASGCQRGEFLVAESGEFLHGLTFEAARQHSGGDAASGGFSTFLLTLLLSLFTAFFFQPFGNGHHQLLMPGRLRRQRADQRPRMFRSSRLQHIAQQRIQLRFCQIALRHQRNQRHLQLGQIAMADMLCSSSSMAIRR